MLSITYGVAKNTFLLIDLRRTNQRLQTTLTMLTSSFRSASKVKNQPVAAVVTYGIPATDKTSIEPHLTHTTKN